VYSGRGRAPGGVADQYDAAGGPGRHVHLRTGVEVDQALRTFLPELIAFQAAHHAINDHLDGLDLPATSALQPWSQDLADAYLTVLLDGLRP
jgi:hypothetical protein